jgi:hypothetical protein
MYGPIICLLKLSLSRMLPSPHVGTSLYAHCHAASFSSHIGDHATVCSSFQLPPKPKLGTTCLTLMGERTRWSCLLCKSCYKTRYESACSSVAPPLCWLMDWATQEFQPVGLQQALCGHLCNAEGLTWHTKNSSADMTWQACSSCCGALMLRRVIVAYLGWGGA